MGLNLDRPGTEGDRLSTDPGNVALRARAARNHSKPAGIRQSRVDLIQIIEGEIIPRLFLAHRNREPHPLVAGESNAGELADREFLARLFLSGDSSDIVNRVEMLLCGGMRREHVYLDLLAPVAGTLSRLWAEGHCSFDEIAVGLCCIDDVLRKLHEREEASPQSR
jgi:hypothetical protein